MEIADALYGVTMRDGVTTVVSQRLADWGSVLSSVADSLNAWWNDAT